MDAVEGSAYSYLDNLLDESQGEKKFPSKSSSPDNNVETSSANGCFDCNICLEFAVDPVVSLCGHLYCWPCIYKWLQVEGTSSQQCPVCKAHLSEETLVPLYGRGSLGRKGEQDTPHRPVLLRDHAVMASAFEHRPLVTEGQIRSNYRQSVHLSELHGLYNNHSDYHGTPSNSFIPSPFHTSILHWSVGSMLTDLVTAILPSMFRNHREFNLYYASPPSPLSGSGYNLRMRRHQIQVANSLHQIWVFLLIFAILCFLLF